jgi:hypothetical protein
MKHGDRKPEIRAGEILWQQAVAAADPESAELADRWACAMEEKLRSGGTKVEHIALATLEEACGQAVARDKAKIKKFVLMLRRPWYRGDSLYRWARKERYL